MIWDRLSKKYDNIMLQKYSLKPTREKVKNIIKQYCKNENFILLDSGCGTAQLLEELSQEYTKASLYGIDKSSGMVEVALEKNINANIKVVDIDDVNKVDDLELSENKFDFIVCTHSFPYYKNKKIVLDIMYNMLKDDGYIIFFQGSINNLYDKFVMGIIEKTAENADYLSRKDFKELVKNKFEVIEEFTIKEVFFASNICGFVLKKGGSNENFTN